MAEVSLVESMDDVTVVALAGRLDMAGVDAVGIRFTAMTAGRHKPTIVDLSGVEFIASLGIGMLIREAKALAKQGARTILAAPVEMVEKALRAASIDAVVPIAPDVLQARALLRPA
jgi:anti-anti-sigma factor